MVNDLKFFLKNKKTGFTGGTSPGEEKVSDEYTEPLFGFGSPSESRAKLEQLKREVLEAQEPSNTNKRKEKAKQLKRERKITTYLNRRRLEREDVRALEAEARRQSSIATPAALCAVPNPPPDVGACLALAQKTNRVDWYTFSPTCENLNRKQKRQLSRKLSILQAIFRGNMERKKISEIPKLVQNEDLDPLAMRKKVFRERKQEREAKEKLDKLIAESKVEYESDFVNKRILPGSVGKPDIFPDGYRGDVKSGPRKSRRYNTSNSEMDYNNISKNVAEPKRKIIKKGPFEYIYKNDKNIVDEPLQPMSIYANVEEELKKHNQKISEKLDKFYIADMELYKKIRNIERQKEDKDGFLDEDGKEVELDPEQKEFLEKYKKFKKDNAEGETVIVDTPNNTKYELYIDKNGLVTVLKYIDENGLITDFNEKDEYEDSQDQTGGSNYDRHLFDALLDALENNDLEQMRVAIESGANVNVQNRRGTSPLIFLAKGYYYPNAEIVDLLLTNNADPNLQDRGGETALHWAAAKGYLEIVKKLLESENIDINITNIDGRNALHSIFDDEEDLFDLEHVEAIMKLLIEKGININETDNSGKTALHLAATQNHGNAVGILLRAGADENIKTYDYHPAGQTAYELAENKKNRVELDRINRLGEIIPGGDLVERLRITQIDGNSVRAVMTLGEEERSFVMPRNILEEVDDHDLWTYEPLALNAFHEFHREKAQAYLAERGQAGITASYLAEEAKNEDSILNSLPHDLEKRISKMLGGTNKSNRKKFFKDLKGRNSHVKRIISEKYGEDVELAEEHTHVDSEGHYVYKLKFKGNVTNNKWLYITPVRIANTPKNEDWISIVNNQIINDISNKLDILEIPQVKNFQPKKNSPKKQSKDIGSLQKVKFLETGDRINSDEPDEIKQQEPDENEAARLAEHARLAAERREEDELAEIFQAWAKESEFDSINTKAAEKEQAHIKGVTSLTRADEPPPSPPRKQPHLTAVERRRAKKEKLRNSRRGELESPPTPPPPDDEIYHRTDGGGQIFSSNKKDYELEFLNNELSKTRKRYNTYGKLLAVNKLIPKNVDNDIWDYAMKKYTFFKKNYYEFRSTNNVLDLAVHHMEWLGDWIDEDTLAAMIKVFNILSVLPPNIHYANSASVLEIKQSIEYALNINSNPQRVLIALLRSQAFLIEYYFFMLNHGISRDRRFNITINKLNSIFTEIYKKKNYELSLYKTIHENPFLSYHEQREMSEIIESVIFYKEIATKSLKIIYELFEEHDKYIFVYLKEQSQKNDEIEKEKDKIKMYKLTNRRKKKSSHWSNHYKTNERRLPEIIETKIDENLL